MVLAVRLPSRRRGAARRADASAYGSARHVRRRPRLRHHRPQSEHRLRFVLGAALHGDGVGRVLRASAARPGARGGGLRTVRRSPDRRTRVLADRPRPARPRHRADLAARPAGLARLAAAAVLARAVDRHVGRGQQHAGEHAGAVHQHRHPADPRRFARAGWRWRRDAIRGRRRGGRGRGPDEGPGGILSARGAAAVPAASRADAEAEAEAEAEGEAEGRRKDADRTSSPPARESERDERRRDDDDHGHVVPRRRHVQHRAGRVSAGAP